MHELCGGEQTYVQCLYNNSHLSVTTFNMFNPFGVGSDFRCNNLKYVDNLTSKVDPRTGGVKYLYWLLTHNIGIQMNRKELTKTFMMTSN